MKKDKKGEPTSGSRINEFPQQSEETRERQQQELREESTPAAGEGTPIYLTGDSTLQTPEEHEHDSRIDPRRDDSIDVSDSDLEEIKAGRLTGREAPEEGDDTK